MKLTFYLLATEILVGYEVKKIQRRVNTLDHNDLFHLSSMGWHLPAVVALVSPWVGAENAVSHPPSSSSSSTPHESRSETQSCFMLCELR